MNHTKMTPGQDPDEFLYIMDSRRDRLNTSTPPEGPTDRQYEGILLQALSPDYESIRRAHLERGDFGLADIRRMMAAIYADNLSRRSITTTGIAGPGVAMKTMDRDLSDETSATSSATTAQRSAITGGTVPTAANSNIRADKISNNPLDNSTRVVGSRRKVAEEVFGVHITKPPLIVTRTAAPNTKKEMEMST